MIFKVHTKPFCDSVVPGFYILKSVLRTRVFLISFHETGLVLNTPIPVQEPSLSLPILMPIFP